MAASQSEQKSTPKNSLGDSFFGDARSVQGTTQKEYLDEYAHLRKKESDVVFILKSFHNKLRKLLELSKTHSHLPEYLERLLVQFDFNDFHANYLNRILREDLESKESEKGNRREMHDIIELPLNPPPFASYLKETVRQVRESAYNEHGHRQVPSLFLFCVFF